MEGRLVDSELKVMDVLWKEGECTAKHVSEVMTERYGWNINTTYTLLKRCVRKGAVERREPNFLCRPLVRREVVQAQETDELLNKVFDGSVELLIASLLDRRLMTPEQIARLKRMLAWMGK